MHHIKLVNVWRERAEHSCASRIEVTPSEAEMKIGQMVDDHL